VLFIWWQKEKQTRRSDFRTKLKMTGQESPAYMRLFAWHAVDFVFVICCLFRLGCGAKGREKEEAFGCLSPSTPFL
jgi:hypothetical protein